jgi:hypothetical protein
MNQTLLVDFSPDKNNKSFTHIRVQLVNKIDAKSGNIILSDQNDNPVVLMAALCEAVCALIHVADQEKIKPSHQSVKDCIKHITDGFADASYRGFITKK